MVRHHQISFKWLKKEKMELCLDQNVYLGIAVSSVNIAPWEPIRMTTPMGSAYLVRISLCMRSI